MNSTRLILFLGFLGKSSASDSEANQAQSDASSLESGLPFSSAVATYIRGVAIYARTDSITNRSAQVVRVPVFLIIAEIFRVSIEFPIYSKRN